MLKAFPNRTSNLKLKSCYTVSLITAQFPSHVMMRGKVTVVKVLQEGCITHKSWSFAFNQTGREWSKRPMPTFLCSYKRSNFFLTTSIREGCTMVTRKGLILDILNAYFAQTRWRQKFCQMFVSRYNFQLSLCLHYLYKRLQEIENNVSKYYLMEIPNDHCYIYRSPQFVL